MPLTFPTNALIKCVIKYTFDGELCENVYALRNQVSDVNADTMCLSIRDIIVRRWALRQVDECVCDSVSVQELFPTLTDPYERAIGEAGSQEGAGLPQLDALVVSIKTGLGGRRNRGRKYIMGVPKDDVTAGRLTSGRQGDWQAKADAIWSDAHGTGGIAPFEIGILHRTSGGAVVPITADSFVPATQLIVQNVLGSMRSRRPGHGS